MHHSAKEINQSRSRSPRRNQNPRYYYQTESREKNSDKSYFYQKNPRHETLKANSTLCNAREDGEREISPPPFSSRLSRMSSSFSSSKNSFHSPIHKRIHQSSRYYRSGDNNNSSSTSSSSNLNRSSEDRQLKETTLHRYEIYERRERYWPSNFRRKLSRSRSRSRNRFKSRSSSIASQQKSYRSVNRFVYDDLLDRRKDPTVLESFPSKSSTTCKKNKISLGRSQSPVYQEDNIVPDSKESQNICPSDRYKTSSLSVVSESNQKMSHSQKSLSQLQTPPDLTKKEQFSSEEKTKQSDIQDQDTTWFESYVCLSQVGEGTFGKVFKGHLGTNLEDRRLVALKRVRIEKERDGFPITAMREIKLLQSLGNSNVVSLLDLAVDLEAIYMIFEYLEHDLSGLLHHPTIRFQEEHVRCITRQMFKGLVFLHKNGIIHRDLKGSNLLISKNGELKIADFGLARLTYEANIALTNRVITLWYRPIELLLGSIYYTSAIDIWSAGCILLELFLRRAPFPGTDELSQIDLIFKICGAPDLIAWPECKDLPWFTLLKPAEATSRVLVETFYEFVPRDALALADRLLQYDPKTRPTALDTLMDDFFAESDSYINGKNVIALLLENSGVADGWHEFESKQRRKKRTYNVLDRPIAPGEPGSIVVSQLDHMAEHNSTVNSLAVLPVTETPSNFSAITKQLGTLSSKKVPETGIPSITQEEEPFAARGIEKPAEVVQQSKEISDEPLKSVRFRKRINDELDFPKSAIKKIMKLLLEKNEFEKISNAAPKA